MVKHRGAVTDFQGGPAGHSPIPSSLDSESVIENFGNFGGDPDSQYQGAVDAFYRDVDGESILKVIPVRDINRTRPLTVNRLSRLIRPSLEAFLRGRVAHGPHLDYAFRDASVALPPRQLDMDTVIEYLERTARVDPVSFVRVAQALFLTHMKAQSSIHAWGSVEVRGEGEPDFKTFPLLNRYQSNRNYVALRDALLDVRQDMPCVFLTLTYSRDLPLDMALLNVTKDWHRFTARLRHELGRLPEYLMTVEFQRDGYPHIHALFFDTTYLFDNGTWKDIQDARSSYASVKTIESMWKRGITYINRTRRGAEVKSPVGYMMKYISKEWGAGRNSPESTLNHALMWITGRRSFNTSRALLPFLHANSENPAQLKLDEPAAAAEGELKCLIVSAPVKVIEKTVEGDARLPHGKLPGALIPEPRPSGVVQGYRDKQFESVALELNPLNNRKMKGEKHMSDSESKNRNSMRPHSEYVCDMCGYSTPDIENARKHAGRTRHMFTEYAFGGGVSRDSD